MLVDLEFYELHAIGRSASSENRTFRVLETFTSINTTSFKAVSITVQNRCGQRSEAVMFILPCEFTCMNDIIRHYDLEKSKAVYTLVSCKPIIIIIISPASSCEMTARVAITFAVLFLGVLLTVVP